MILVEPDGEIALIRLDRAPKRNALTPTMLASLADAIDRAASARALVLGGMGDVFCAGFDLSLCRDNPNALEQLLRGLSRVVLALRQAPCAVVIGAHGAAIAGGCALLGGGDFVITNQDAKLGYPVVKLGISPAVSAPTLGARTNWGHARERLLDPDLISGAEAARIGLASESLPLAQDVWPRAREIGMQLAAKPRHAIGWTKAWLRELDGCTPESIESGLRASLGLVHGVECVERLASIWTKSDKR